MYKNIIEQYYSDIQSTYEDNVMKLVQSYGFTIDKDELVKALQYDRHQYEQGFRDGILESRTHAHWINRYDTLFPAESEYECSYCHSRELMALRYHSYCPCCGSRMDEEV